MKNTTGKCNVGVGLAPLHCNTTGCMNIAVGVQAMRFNQTGCCNVAVGRMAMYGQAGANNAKWNVVIGDQAGMMLNTGDNNVLVGQKAGERLASGNYNVLLGNQASASTADVTHEIIIGSGADATTGFHGAGTETIRVGRASDYITCDFGENATWAHSSDIRINKDIKDTTL